MSIPQSAGGAIESRADLVRYLETGSKPKSEWRIGTEHEKFVYDLKTKKPVPYDGPSGIRAMLEGMRRFGWEPVMEGDNIIGLSQNGGSISLEPGGQFELSGAALFAFESSVNIGAWMLLTSFAVAASIHLHNRQLAWWLGAYTVAALLLWCATCRALRGGPTAPLPLPLGR